ncbi:hypothetical protein [Lysinibacillus xylanilyticus]|uniref:Uncharacterized protein n=1 Tax=Lysinibacillus xylanilyticus TaxID=582475 RepID=A0A2M9QA08_9BACI|nr:hypothetical protein [Lysinibacillus xylanilyticus]PJO44875.1 hypothetical protein CWD94_04095 [Lysinibacillus xylanilyticus]
MKDFKKGLFLFLLGLSIFIDLMAYKALDAGNTKLAQQIIMTWVALISSGVLFTCGFLYALRK